MCVCHRQIEAYIGSCTLTTGGGEGKSLLFSVKSSTLMVADMITSFNGWPCYEIKEEGEGGMEWREEGGRGTCRKRVKGRRGRQRKSTTMTGVRVKVTLLLYYIM